MNIRNIQSLYFYLHAIKRIPNVKQNLVCSFAGLHILLLSLCEFIIPECIQRAMHLLLPCCHDISILKISLYAQIDSVICLHSGIFPQLQLKNALIPRPGFSSSDKFKFLLWDFKKYFTIYLLYAFGLFNVELYFIIFLQVPAFADRNFDLWYHHIPVLPVYLNISINQVISILAFINFFLFPVSPD